MKCDIVPIAAHPYWMTPAFCMECGASIPVSGIPKDGPKQRAPQTKKKRKSLNRYPASRTWLPPDLPDAGYDGYYDDTPTLDEGAFKEKLDKGLIKQIILVGASAATIVALAIVLMKLL